MSDKDDARQHLEELAKRGPREPNPEVAQALKDINAFHVREAIEEADTEPKG